MEAQDKNYFENAWRNAMEGANVPPDAHVWEGIEKTLDGKAGKGKLVFMIKFAIAASFLFAMSTATFLFVNNYQSPEDRLSQNQSPGEAQTIDPQIKDGVKAPQKMETESSVQGGQSNEPDAAHATISQMNEASATPQTDTNEENYLLSSFAADWLEGIREIFISEEQEPEVIALEKVPYLPAYSGKRSTQASWAGLNFSGGSMSNVPGEAVSNFQVADFENTTGAIQVARTETNTPGNSVNIGFGVGKKVGSRWLVQGGLNFSRRNATGTSNVIASGNSVALNMNSRTANYSITEPYQVDHQLSYITMPVQVGYTVVDRKVDVNVLGGFSGDMLVGHRVTDNSGEYASTNLGDDSGFRKFGVSALLTTEVSYPLGKHYVVSAYPQVRQDLTSLQKEESSDDLPLSLEFGFRLSYVF